MKGPFLYKSMEVSRNGYRRGHTPTPQKLIPSNAISMLEDDGSPLEAGPILGVGTTTGNKKVMQPGETYTFAGDKSVVETPFNQGELNCGDFKVKGRGKKKFKNACRKVKLGLGNLTDFFGITDFEDDGTVISRYLNKKRKEKKRKEKEKRSYNPSSRNTFRDSGRRKKVEEEEYCPGCDPNEGKPDPLSGGWDIEQIEVEPGRFIEGEVIQEDPFVMKKPCSCK